MITNILARKGNVCLVKYESGLYAVEKITKASGTTITASANKEAVVNFFAQYVKSVRRGKNDMNLEVYAA